MPDLNELLRWSIANTPTDSSAAPPTTQPTEQLSLQFHPANRSQVGTSALHPSDPLYRASHLSIDDASPASTPGPLTPAALPRQELNTDILDVIMGKSDSTMMKEKMGYAMDETNDVEKRIEALDDFEMMIELIDNANNMTVLKMWEPLLSLLQSKEDGIVAHACWIIGTAVQNNLKAQAAMFIHNTLPLILNIIQPSSSSRQHPTSTRARATYALSSSVKHWPLASSALSSSSDAGYSVLATSASDPVSIIRRKTAFLINTLVLQSGEMYEGEIPKEVQALLEERMKQTSEGDKSEVLIDGLKRTGVFGSLLKGLKEYDDVEYEENAIRALSQASVKGGLSTEEKEEIRGIWQKWRSNGQEERGFEGEDGKEVERLLQV